MRSVHVSLQGHFLRKPFHIAYEGVVKCVVSQKSFRPKENPHMLSETSRYFNYVPKLPNPNLVCLRPTLCPR